MEGFIKKNIYSFTSAPYEPPFSCIEQATKYKYNTSVTYIVFTCLCLRYSWVCLWQHICLIRYPQGKHPAAKALTNTFTTGTTVSVLGVMFTVLFCDCNVSLRKGNGLTVSCTNCYYAMGCDQWERDLQAHKWEMYFLINLQLDFMKVFERVPGHFCS